MTYALDASYSLGREPSGVAVYCSGIIRELASADAGSRFLLCYRANRFLPALMTPLPGPNCSRRLLEESASFLLPRNFDLFHGLNQRLPKVPLPRAVTTFHDLFVMSGDYSTPEFRKRFTALAKDAAERSDHIIAISKFTAGQVSQHLNYPESQITVVHHGVDPIPEVAAVSLKTFHGDMELQSPFLLHVGAIQKRKNIARLVEAFEGLPSQYLLVLAGSAGYGAEHILGRVEKSPAKDRIRLLGYLTRNELNHLYRSATVLAFPSLEEGFGLPVLEAMSAGLPVVTSNASALCEVAGDAALLVDPTDVDAIRDAIWKVLEDATLRESMRTRGLARAARFTWQEAAARTLAVYRGPS